MSKFILLFLILCSCVRVFGADAKMELPPRVVLAEKNGARIFLLPETHLGMSYELDNYFHEVVLPLARRANHVFAEGVHERVLMYPGLADCQIALDAEVGLRLNKIMLSIFGEKGSLQGRVWSRASQIESFGSYEKFEILSEVGLAYEFDSSTRRPKSVITNELAVKLISIELFDELRDEFCSLPVSERNLIVGEAIVKFDEARLRRGVGVDRMWVDRMMGSIVDGIYNEVSCACVSGDIGVVQGSAIDGFLLAARNRIWVKKLDRVAVNSGGAVLAVLGAAHFVRSNGRAGLLQLLREAGYNLSIIRDQKHLGVELGHAI